MPGVFERGKALSCEPIELLEESLIDGLEVETRLALHAGLELGGEAVEQLGGGINGHEVIADVRFADLDPGDGHWRFVAWMQAAFEAITPWRVFLDRERADVFLQDRPQPGEDRFKFGWHDLQFISRRGCSRRAARRISDIRPATAAIATTIVIRFMAVSPPLKITDCRAVAEARSGAFRRGTADEFGQNASERRLRRCPRRCRERTGSHAELALKSATRPPLRGDGALRL